MRTLAYFGGRNVNQYSVMNQFSRWWSYYLQGPEDVAKMGVAAYNAECRKIVMRYSKEWEVRGEGEDVGSEGRG